MEGKKCSRRFAGLIKASILCLLILLLVPGMQLLGVFLYFNNQPSPVENRNFAPDKCPNTLWVCQEKDICLVVDQNAEVRGWSEVSNETSFFLVNIDRCGTGTSVFVFDWVNRKVLSYSGISFSAVFDEEKCIIEYTGETDREMIWGDENGNIVLTFVKQELSSPVIFVENGFFAGNDIVIFESENDPLHGT